MRLIAVVLVLLGALVGCAADPAAAPAAPDGRAGDVAYAQAMIPHHEQALELSALVAGRSSSPEVADLAFRIDREQVEEIGQLQGFTRLAGAPQASDDSEHAGHAGHAGHDAMGAGMAGMPGMADAATLERLRTTSGPAFDRLWLETMVAHHEGALAMAREHLASGGAAGPLAEFSRTLLVSQQAEIDRMRGM